MFVAHTRLHVDFDDSCSSDTASNRDQNEQNNNENNNNNNSNNNNNKSNEKNDISRSKPARVILGEEKDRDENVTSIDVHLGRQKIHSIASKTTSKPFSNPSNSPPHIG